MSRVIVAIIAVASTTLAVGRDVHAKTTGTLRVAEQPFTITTGRATFVFQTSALANLPFDAQLKVQLHNPVASRESLQLVADESVAIRTIDEITFDYFLLPRDSLNRLVVVVPIQTTKPAEAAIDLLQPGVYPITFSVVSGDRDLGSTLTFVNRPNSDDALNKVKVSYLINYLPAPSRGPDGIPSISEAQRTSIDRLTQIVLRNDVPLSLTLPAEVIESMAQSGSASDVLMLSDLSSALARRSVISTTYMQLSPSTAVSEGLESEFTRQWRLAEDVVGANVPAANARRSVYPEVTVLDDRGAALLPDLGVRSVVLYPQVSASLDRSIPNGVVARVALPNGSNLGVYTTLDTTDALFDDGVTDPTRRGIRLAAEVLMERADLLRAGYSTSDIHLVVAPPTGLVPRPLVTSSFLDALRTTAAVQLSDLSDIQSVDATAPALSLLPRSEVSVTGIGAAMYSLNVERTTVGSMLPANDLRLSTWDRQLAVVASRGSAVAGGADDHITGLKQQFDAIRKAVSLPELDSVTLTDRRGTIRVILRNSADVPLTVRLTVASSKLILPQASQIVELQPASSTDVTIPVEARSSGRFPVTIRVTTPTGRARVVSPVTLTANVNAIAGVGQLVGLSALLLVGAWWFAHWRRQRREQLTPESTVGSP
jgi:hypothetical protein